MGPSPLLSVLLGVCLLPMDLTADILPSSVRSMIDVCPPVNSPWHLMNPLGADMCDGDNECPGSMKCCCTDSGRQCVSPIQVKLGRCPPSQAMCSHMSSRPTCGSDVDCPGSQRCCDICGKTCWNPEPDPDGSCPAPTIILRNPSCSIIQCASDSECPSDQKCCLQLEGQKCTKIPSALNAQDMCPSAKNQNCASPQVNECKKDSQCPAPQKCCCSNCGWKCVIPVKVKPGRCPTRDPRCRGAEYPMCQSDIDCPENQKCCNTCGMKCADPQPEPPGVCPVSEVPDVHYLQCSSVMCSSNEDCAPQRRCCLNEENQKCMQPQPEVLRVCPPFSPDIFKMAKDVIGACQNDSECPSPLKCCCSDHGWTCLAPVQVKPGRCPPIKPKCKDTNPQPLCENDSNCPSNKKCCDICGKSCWAPDPEPFGSCPVMKDMVKPHCSAVRCSRDADCAAEEKCCVSNNSQKCVQPYPAPSNQYSVEMDFPPRKSTAFTIKKDESSRHLHSPHLTLEEVVQSVCPRFNPVGCSSGKVKDDCSFDVQCPRKKKCCCTACGRKCVTPAQVKPGRCPNIPYMCSPFPPDPMCETDTDCPRVEKCCNICGFTCHAPVPEPLGVCPVSQVKEKMLGCPSILCTSDDNCSERKKCCLSVDKKSCTLPVEELSPSGMLQVCPLSNNSACLPNKSYLNECQWDKDCSSSQKCCCSGCRLKCSIPEEVKSGRCPRQTPSPQEVLKASKCQKDSNCPGDMKCCPALGSRCWKPILEPPGTCRALSDPRNASCSFFTCTSHDDCPLLTKCCPTSYGQTCLFINNGDIKRNV